LITGDFNEGTKSLLELVKEADYRFLKSLNKKAIEPDSKIAYDIEREKGTHASLGRDLSSPGDFQKVRFGREWPREESYYHKGIPDWHPDEIRTEGVQKPPVSRENDFYPEIKVKNGRRGE
jgi:hypothetical protein